MLLAWTGTTPAAITMVTTRHLNGRAEGPASFRGEGPAGRGNGTWSSSPDLERKTRVRVPTVGLHGLCDRWYSSPQAWRGGSAPCRARDAASSDAPPSAA